MSLLDHLARLVAGRARRPTPQTRDPRAFSETDAPPHEPRSDDADAAAADALRRRAESDLAVINRIAAAAHLPQIRLWDEGER